MHWVILAVAIIFEVSGTTMMKQSHSFTRLVPSLLMFLFYGIGFALMTVVLLPPEKMIQRIKTSLHGWSHQ